MSVLGGPRGSQMEQLQGRSRGKPSSGTHARGEEPGSPGARSGQDTAQHFTRRPLLPCDTGSGRVNLGCTDGETEAQCDKTGECKVGARKPVPA